MKITIIGGSGFLGTRLIYLLKTLSGVELLNIDKQQSQMHPEITKIGDVRDLDVITALLAGTELVILLAAEHKDNVEPRSLYYDVNVDGMQNTFNAMKRNNVHRIIFTSSVAVYGLNKLNPTEETPTNPFNDYGCSKRMAEMLLHRWYTENPEWSINIIRPTVIFGENNRGNVYNLLHQIASGRFVMIGNGENVKSMAYVGNVAAFIVFLAKERKEEGFEVFNYADKPDFTMNDLVNQVGVTLNKRIPTFHLPYWLGMLAGYGFDLLSYCSRKKYSVSAVRIKKFCAVTQFDTSKLNKSGFQPVYKLEEGLKQTLEYEFARK